MQKSEVLKLLDACVALSNDSLDIHRYKWLRTRVVDTTDEEWATLLDTAAHIKEKKSHHKKEEADESV